MLAGFPLLRDRNMKSFQERQAVAFFFLVLWQHEFLLGRAIDGLL